MKPAFYIFAVLLFSLLGCGKEPLEIPKPDLSIDWQKHVFTDVRPVDETGYPPCSKFPMVFNPGHEDNYELRFEAESFISKIQFQKGRASSYMVYVRHIPEKVDDLGALAMRGVAVLLDLRSGETIELGATTGRPSIGANHVIFPNFGEITVYDIRMKSHERIVGALEEIKVSPDGKHVFFSSLAENGGFEPLTSYVYQIVPWEKIYEVPQEDLFRATWSSDTTLLFRSFENNRELQELELLTNQVRSRFGPYDGSGFAGFSDVSDDLSFAYGYYTYVKSLVSGVHLDLNEAYDGLLEECETRDYGSIYILPNGELLVERIYHTIDNEKQAIRSRHLLRLFDADGTNERMVTLLLKQV